MTCISCAGGRTRLWRPFGAASCWNPTATGSGASDGLRAHGLGSNAAEAGALLARALLMQGRVDEAEAAVSRESESLAGESFQTAIDWRGVRAELLAARGDHGAAVELARRGRNRRRDRRPTRPRHRARLARRCPAPRRARSGRRRRGAARDRAVGGQGRLAADRARDDAVLALEPEALLVRRTWLGTDRRGGGSYENVNLVLFIFGADGRVARGEAFDVDDEVEALARFDELVRNARSDLSPPTSANAAARAAQRLLDAHRALDIERAAQTLAPGFHNIDRRRMLQTDRDREQFIESFRWVFQKVSRFDPATRLLATRGDRLALFHARWVFTEPGGGPSEIEFLQIWETDASGRIAGGVGFDPDDIDAAYAELEARYTALGAVRHPIHSPRC
jgi:hypothetical protein